MPYLKKSYPLTLIKNENSTEKSLVTTEMIYSPNKATSNKFVEVSDIPQKSKRRLLSLEAIAVLKEWLFSPEHVNFPYPSEMEKKNLMKKTGLSSKQLKYWFINARRRIWKEKELPSKRKKRTVSQFEKIYESDSVSLKNYLPKNDIISQKLYHLKDIVPIYNPHLLTLLSANEISSQENALQTHIENAAASFPIYSSICRKRHDKLINEASQALFETKIGQPAIFPFSTDHYLFHIVHNSIYSSAATMPVHSISHHL